MPRRGLELQPSEGGGGGGRGGGGGVGGVAHGCLLSACRTRSRHSYVRGSYHPSVGRYSRCQDVDREVRFIQNMFCSSFFCFL